MMLKTPPEISESLTRFKETYPDPAKVGFLMMRFNKTKTHADIVDAIGETLSRFGLVALRADSSQYHDVLPSNVKTYMWGCGFGIAVFDRIASDDVNPNVSFEVGYMSALQKPVCFLKDATLPALQTDLAGKLYRSFNTRKPKATIPKELEAWMRDKTLIPVG
jgi:nucleoside 2-deoxyribosyltransferase